MEERNPDAKYQLKNKDMMAVVGWMALVEHYSRMTMYAGIGCFLMLAALLVLTSQQ